MTEMLQIEIFNPATRGVLNTIVQGEKETTNRTWERAKAARDAWLSTVYKGKKLDLRERRK